VNREVDWTRATIALEQLRAAWTPIVTTTAPAIGTVAAHADSERLVRFRLRCSGYVAGTVESTLEVRGPSLLDRLSRSAGANPS
jgi:hypothetical protein